MILSIIIIGGIAVTALFVYFIINNNMGERITREFHHFPILFTTIILLGVWGFLGLVSLLADNNDKQRDYKLREIQEETIKITPLDSIIKERRQTKFNHSIFAGIEFGDSQGTVNQKLKAYTTKFGKAIYADSSRYAIKDIKAEYYKDKLHTLTINLGQVSFSQDTGDLWKLYEAKYGETDYHDWIFLDASIEYKEVAVRRKANNLNGYNGRQYYYDENGKWTETQIYDRILTYQSKEILKEIERDREIEYQKRLQVEKRQDSIRKSKELEQKKIAKQLSEDQFDNI